tara:strand:- start:11 stop:1276 length:1266 start_codon:yes stop_codon:yes gene_type:complete
LRNQTLNAQDAGNSRTELMDKSDRMQTDEKTTVQDAAFDAVVSYSERLAHDANNYIGAILGLADVLPALADDSEQVMKIATRIAAAGRLLQVVVNQALLPASRHADDASLDMDAALDIAERMAKHLIGPRIEFELTPPPVAATLALSKSEFSTLLFILLRNACDAALTSDGHAPHIRVRFDVLEGEALVAETARQVVMLGRIPEGRAMALRVEDNGAGFAPALQQDIGSVFRPFVSHSRRKSALGLGLSFAVAIAERRGAALGAVQSADTGFTAYLPFDETLSAADMIGAAQGDEAAPQVLIVDPMMHWGAATATLLSILDWPARQLGSITEVVAALDGAPRQRHVVVLRLPPRTVTTDEARALSASFHGRYNVDLALLVGPVNGLAADDAAALALGNLGALSLAGDAVPADIVNYLIPNI